MAKERVSATIDKETSKKIKELLDGDEYRNQSHIIEKAIKLFWEAKRDKNKK